MNEYNVYIFYQLETHSNDCIFVTSLSLSLLLESAVTVALLIVPMTESLRARYHRKSSPVQASSAASLIDFVSLHMHNIYNVNYITISIILIMHGY